MFKSTERFKNSERPTEISFPRINFAYASMMKTEHAASNVFYLILVHGKVSLMDILIAFASVRNEVYN